MRPREQPHILIQTPASRDEAHPIRTLIRKDSVMAVAIQTRAVQKRYGSHTALHSLDLTVETGSVFGLIGPNGAGKTTALRL